MKLHQIIMIRPILIVWFLEAVLLGLIVPCVLIIQEGANQTVMKLELYQSPIH